jgi:predicted Zn-dependent protease
MIVGSDSAAAEKDYAEALKSRPHDARLLAKSAEACLMTDGPADPRRARTAALSALAINPRETAAVQTLAEIALYERHYAEAVVRLKQLAAAQPANAWSKVELGVAYGQLGQPGEAVRYLEPLLKAGYPDPKGQLHGQLAVALRKLGRTEEAGQAAAEASRLADVYLKNGVREGTDAP